MSHSEEAVSSSQFFQEKIHGILSVVKELLRNKSPKKTKL